MNGFETLKPCDCEPGFCNNLPNPFKGYFCIHDGTTAREQLQALQADFKAVSRQVVELTELLNQNGIDPA